MRTPIHICCLCLTAAATLPAQRVHYTIDRGGRVPSVCPAGDVDGDGFPDFSLSTLDLEQDMQVVAGRTGAIVETLPEVGGYRPLRRVDLDGDGRRERIATSADWTAGLVRVTPGPGSVVSTFTFPGADALPTGDIDGDGVRDLLIAELQPPQPSVSSGVVHVVSGRDGRTLRTVPAGPGVVEAFGVEIVDLGDVDGDGRPDAAIGALGSVGVYSLATGAQLHDLGHEPRATRWGRALANLGDVDGDGVADLAAGAGQNNRQTVGFVRVFSGATGARIRELRGREDHYFGRAVAGIADVDGDGVTDLAVGASQVGFYGHPVTGPGYVHVFSGATGALLFTEYGPAGHHGFGESIAPIGDVDHDGSGEILVGSHPFVQDRAPFVAVSGRARTATSDTHLVHVGRAEQQRLRLHLDASLAGAPYVVLGTVSGPEPGIDLPGRHLPLTPDPYLTFTASGLPGFLDQPIGTVGNIGSATVTFDSAAVPGLAGTLLLGLTFDHAFLVLTPNRTAFETVSDPVPLTILR